MLTINKIFPQEKIPEKTESFLFFDIETTGFSRDNTIDRKSTRLNSSHL